MNHAARLLLYRIFAVVLVVALSIGFGFAFDAVMTSFEKREYPIPDAYAEYVSRYSDEYGVPADIIYSVIKVESDFNGSAHGDDGAIGLMQLTPSILERLCSETGEELTPETLYSPEINIKYGSLHLSQLYSKYGIWETCFAAYHAGEDTVDSWIAEKENVDGNGILIKYPSEQTSSYIDELARANKNYRKLYFE